MSTVEARRRQMQFARSFRSIQNAALACAIAVTADALPEHGLPQDAALSLPYTRAVTMERDLRAEPEAFARKAGITQEEFRSRYGASGLVRCGEATGSGQLALADDVLATAGHVFFARGGKLRSPACYFEPTGAPGSSIPIDMTSIVTGSPDPMEERATRDWAVARLKVPPENISPYILANESATPSPVTLYSGGNGRAATTGVERCHTRRVTAMAPEGIRELSFDCSAEPGGSGAALLNDKNEVVAIFVGFRSVDATRARPYSDLHYNFAITVEGPFRRALLEAARKR
jgi:hypothetical protein